MVLCPKKKRNKSLPTSHDSNESLPSVTSETPSGVSFSSNNNISQIQENDTSKSKKSTLIDEKSSTSSYNKEKGGEHSYDFRRIQEESRRELAKSSGKRVCAKNNEGLRERLSTIFRRELDSRGYNASFNRLLHLESKNNIKFDIYQNIDGDLFHDIFEITKTYTGNG